MLWRHRQVRYTYLVDRLLAAGKHVLCVGETGTGKTLNVTNKLMNEMPPEVRGGWQAEQLAPQLQVTVCALALAKCCSMTRSV